MAGLNCAFDSATALRHVFIPSIREAPNCLHVRRILVPALLSQSQQRQKRCFTETSHHRNSILDFLKSKATRKGAGAWGSNAYKSASLQPPAPSARPTSAPPVYTPTSTRAANPQRERLNVNRPGPRVTTKLARLPRDDEIRAQYVYVQEKDANGNEQWGEMRLTRQVLALLDRKVESLQVVVKQNPNDPEAPKWPMAVIVNKKEELVRAQKERDKKKQAASTNKEKELEVNWSMAPHDVEHKWQTLQTFLRKGYKVQLLLMKKRGKAPTASKKQAQELLEKLAEAVAAVPGSKEWKGREGQILGTMRIFLQGKRQEVEDKKEIVLTKKAKKEAKKAKWEQQQKEGHEVKETMQEEHEEARDGGMEEAIDEDPVIAISRRA